jgi:uncharacterized protein (DUF433 family)
MTDAANTTVLSINLITSNPKVREGRPCIAGTSITVADIASIKIFQMKSAEEIADDYELPPQQVYAALAYYYDHKGDIDESIRGRRKLAEELKGKRVGSRSKSLFG